MRILRLSLFTYLTLFPGLMGLYSLSYVQTIKIEVLGELLLDRGTLDKNYMETIGLPTKLEREEHKKCGYLDAPCQMRVTWI